MITGRIIESLETHPDLVVAEGGDWSDYGRTPHFAVAPGRKFESLELDYTHHFVESWPTWKSFKEDLNGSHTLQVGLPSHLDLALVAFGFKADKALRNLAPFRDATVREITKIYDRAGGDVVFQLEIPIPLILVMRLPKPAQAVAANRLAAELTKMVGRTPPGTRFGIHLCYGDMNNKATGDPEDCGSLVRLANSILSAWPRSQRLEFIHAPFARGEAPPSTEFDFYAPLAELNLPYGVRFASGVVHELLDLDEQVKLRDRIDSLIGHKADVATACGLGATRCRPRSGPPRVVSKTRRGLALSNGNRVAPLGEAAASMPSSQDEVGHAAMHRRSLQCHRGPGGGDS